MSNPYPPFIISLAVFVLLAAAFMRLPAALARESISIAETQALLGAGIRRAARQRVFTALAVGGLAFSVLDYFHPGGTGTSSGQSPWFGLAQGLAPTLAGVAAIAVLALWPLRAWPASSVRMASLERRRWRSADWRPFLPLAMTIVTLGIFVTCVQSTALQLEAGDPSSFVVTEGTYAIDAAPYPGWAYGAPVLAGLVALMVLTVVVVRRSTGRVTSAAPHLIDANRVMRHSIARFALGVATAVALASLGEFVWATGSTVTSSATVFESLVVYTKPGSYFCSANCSKLVFVQPTYAIGIFEIAVGALTVAFALLVLVRSVACSPIRMLAEDAAPARENAPT